MKPNDTYIHFNGLKSTGLYLDESNDRAILSTDFSDKVSVMKAVSMAKSVIAKRGRKPIIHESLKAYL